MSRSVTRSAQKRPRRNRRVTDRKLRERAFDRLADPEIEAKIGIENAAMWVEWIKSGKRPGVEKPRLVAGTEVRA